MSAVEDVLFNDNSFYNDLEQLRLDIDAYVDVTSKRISSKRFEKKAFLKKKRNSSRSCFRKFHYTPITDTTYDLRLIKAMTLQLSRINTLVGNKQDDFIQAVMDRIADMELTELAGSQEIDVCELVTKLSQYLKVRNTKIMFCKLPSETEYAETKNKRRLIFTKNIFWCYSSFKIY